MKILFLVGCIEPGRSGVGDYTRLLAEACACRGHSCEIISLNDPYVDKAERVTVHVGKTSIAQMRVPAGTFDSSRLSMLNECLERFAPDWVSLQFVTYAFQRRGLIWPKLGNMARLLQKWRLQLMFHELWIGEYEGAPLKERFVGFLQKCMLKRFLSVIASEQMHTSTPLYRFLLKNAGIEAQLLPMFGTIAVEVGGADEWLPSELETRGIPIDVSSLSSYWLIGFFGSIHPGFPYRDVMPELQKAASDLGRKAIAISIGNAGPGALLWEQVRKEFGETIHVVSLGMLPEKKVSQLLNSLDIGVTSTPLDIIGKSSSVAVMLDHGMRVLVPELGKSGWSDSGLMRGVFTRDQFFGQRKYAEPFDRHYRCSLDTTADQFLADLGEQVTGVERRIALD